MKITAIRQQVKRADRYSIFVDGTYAFSLSESGLLEAKLASGLELDTVQLEGYKQLSQDDKAYNNALRYAAMRPRSEWELRTYLQRKATEEPVAERITAKLRTIGLLDDYVFARAWVDNRRQLKPTSVRKLRLELKQKHVADELINRVLQEDAGDDRAELRRLAAKKRQIPRYRDDPTKLMQYLARQGFGYDDIKSVLQDDDA